MKICTKYKGKIVKLICVDNDECFYELSDVIRADYFNDDTYEKISTYDRENAYYGTKLNKIYPKTTKIKTNVWINIYTGVGKIVEPCNILIILE